MPAGIDDGDGGGGDHAVAADGVGGGACRRGVDEFNRARAGSRPSTASSWAERMIVPLRGSFVASTPAMMGLWERSSPRCCGFCARQRTLPAGSSTERKSMPPVRWARSKSDWSTPRSSCTMVDARVRPRAMVAEEGVGHLDVALIGGPRGVQVQPDLRLHLLHPDSAHVFQGHQQEQGIGQHSTAYIAISRRSSPTKQLSTEDF